MYIRVYVCEYIYINTHSMFLRMASLVSHIFSTCKHKFVKDAQLPVKKRTTELFDILKSDRNPLQRITEMLETIKLTEDIRHYRDLLDDEGWSLLTLAVLGNHPDVVCLLLREGWACHVGLCTTPLHAACWMGHELLVQILLSHGSRPDTKSAVCLSSTTWHSCASPTAHVKCYNTTLLLPLEVAVMRDNKAVLQLLLLHEKSAAIVKNQCSGVLLLACKSGAKDCCKYILEIFPDQILDISNYSKSTIEYVLSQDIECFTSLIESNKMSQVRYSCGGSVLHAIFRQRYDTGLRKLVELALKRGLVTNINSLDKSLVTPLELLLHQIAIFTEGGAYSEELLDTLELLLDYGADSNRLITAYNAGSNRLVSTEKGAICALFIAAQGRFYQYNSAVPSAMLILRTLEIIFNHHDRNCIATLINGLLVGYISLVCSLQRSDFQSCQTVLEDIMTLILRRSYSCDGSNIEYSSIHKLYEKTRFNVASAPFEKSVSAIMFCEKITLAFLENGMDPSRDLHLWRTFLTTANTLSTDAHAWLSSVCTCLRHLIIHGGNPNNIPGMFDRPSVTGGTGRNIHIVHKAENKNIDLVIRIIRNNLFHEDEVVGLLKIFYCTLNQHNLYNMFKAIEHVMGNYSGNEESCHRMSVNLARSFTTEPRTLVNISRIAVHNSLNWKAERHIRDTGLPNVLIKFVLDVA